MSSVMLPNELTDTHKAWLFANAADCVDGMDLANRFLSTYEIIDSTWVYDIANEVFDLVMQRRTEEKYA